MLEQKPCSFPSTAPWKPAAHRGKWGAASTPGLGQNHTGIVPQEQFCLGEQDAGHHSPEHWSLLGSPASHTHSYRQVPPMYSFISLFRSQEHEVSSQLKQVGARCSLPIARLHQHSPGSISSASPARGSPGRRGYKAGTDVHREHQQHLCAHLDTQPATDTGT